MEYDTIVVGSGVGGLTTAAALSQRGKRVLVLERHDRFGGYIHSFKRKNWSWNIGTHYLGQLQNGDRFDRLFHSITGNQIRFEPLGEKIDVVQFLDKTYEIYSDVTRMRRMLEAEFPDEALSLKRFWSIVDKIGKRLFCFLLPKLLPRQLAGLAYNALTLPVCFYRRKTIRQVVESMFSNEKLKQLLYYHTSKIGIGPDETSFLFYAMICYNLRRGGCYPVGGGDAIVDALVDVIERHGGELRTKFDVQRILVDQGEAKGILSVDNEKIYADNIVSNIGIKETVTSLLRPRDVPMTYRSKMQRYKSTLSYIGLFVGFEGDIREVGADTANYRVYGRAPYDYSADPTHPSWQPSVVIMMFQSLRDEKHSDSKYHTCEVIVPAEYSWFSKWFDKKPYHRGQEYESAKSRIRDKLLEALEERFPGIGKFIRYTELGTPVTYQYYCGHSAGSCLGMGLTPEKFNDMDIHPTTPVKDLYYAGADVFSHGILGSFISGVLAASSLLKENLFLKI